MATDAGVALSSSQLETSSPAATVDTKGCTIDASEFQQKYDDLPAWDIGRPQPEFVNIADHLHGSILDVGCGTGENALFFAERGHTVTGVDFLAGPIETAQRKNSERGCDVTFKQHDALKLSQLNEKFDNVLDSGLLHSFSNDDLQQYVAGLAAVTHPGSKLFVLCFSELEPGSKGPRRLSETAIRELFADNWKFESMTRTRFIVREDTQANYSDDGPHAWFFVAERV
ncbi:class I SAM-dependent methyltransferase [Rhodopirellula sp. ICT_H3.1]|uniref:Class I SAM-dependent methyltransferase n=1 Tax=Aporhodopirellula aestuarii TaxID=2950107 RepID=A0ABT0U5W9_9BACT|nr:class I SAM-dependent methyltransferase [Aporhodopirellula aestuarii]